MYDADIDTRKRVRAILRACYNIRGALVHTGIVTSMEKVQGKKMTAARIVEETAKICAHVIRQFLIKGDPDWDALELGRAQP